MLKIKCFICKNELSQQGGLLFSPPNKEFNVKKLHFCFSCYVQLIKQIKSFKKGLTNDPR